MKKIIVLSILILIGALSACLDETAEVPQEEVKLEIITFSILMPSLPSGLKSCVVKGDDYGTVVCDFPYGTDVTNLVARYYLSDGTSLYLDDVLQESGITANDFSDKQKIYVQKDAKGNSRNWAVNVFVLPNTESILYSASVLVDGFEYVCAISETEKKVTVDIFDKYTDDLQSVKFKYVISEKAGFIIKGNWIDSEQTTVNIGSYVDNLTITIKSEVTSNGLYTPYMTETVYQFIVKCIDCGN